MQNFHFLYSCNTSLLWGPANIACNLQKLLELFSSGYGYQRISMAATSFPCWLKQQLLMLLSCSSAVHYKPDKADRRICFCHSWQQPQADRRLHFQLVFYHSDCFNSMNMVFLVSCCVQCSLLREAGGVSHCPSTFLTLMARGQRSHTSETEQTHAKPFCCSRKNFAATLHLCKLILSIIRSKVFMFHVVFLPGWVERKRGLLFLFNFKTHIGFSVP